MTRPRARVLVTGSELVRGEWADADGPFLARELVGLGVEPERITIVGDARDALEDAVREGLRADLCVVSGGLGPTHDDRTVEAVAGVTGRRLVVDSALEHEIEAFSRARAEQLGRPYADFAVGVRKQATIPEGAVSLGLAGTAPGLVVAQDDRVVVVLPGPPGELRRLWRAARDAEPVRRILERATPPGRRILRFFGAPESAVARALEEAGGEPEGIEATICARDYEIHVDLVVGAGAERAAAELERALAVALEPFLFARDPRPVEAHVLALCRARGLTLATAESCTGGMVASRLTAIPGASEVFAGGVVAYADDVKRSELSVPEETLARYGAVSAETAAAMSEGVRSALGADVAVAVTGVAGPGGGTPTKPVGLVHLAVSGPDGTIVEELMLPGNRDAVRRRATVSALHLVRRLLSQERHEAA